MEWLPLLLWFLVAAALPVCAAVWLLWLRLRDGRITGGWRAAFVGLCIVASWYVAMVFVYVVGGQHVAALLLSVLWAIGGLSWATIALGDWRNRQPRRIVTTDAAAPDANQFAQAMERKRRAYAMRAQRAI